MINMNNGIAMLKKRWLALAAVVVLLAVALTAGTLTAASARPQPDAAGRSEPVAPVPERVAWQLDDEQVEIGLPPIEKEPPKYPNLDSNLNRLAEAAAAPQNPASVDGNAAGPSAKPVLVTFYVQPDRVAGVREFLEDNDVFVRNVGEDYIEAHVPPGLLAEASQRPGVLRVDTAIPPRPAQSRGNVFSQGVGLHGADAWHDAGYRGQNVKVGVIDTGFEGFSRLQGSGELPRNVTARCYFEDARAPSSRLADCEVDSEHGTAVAETLIDVAPAVELYIANPKSTGDLRNAADWVAKQGVQVINMSLGWIVDGPGDGTSPSSSDSPLRTIDAAVLSGITWVNAGGNSAREVWYGRFSDTDNNGWHNYTTQGEANKFIVREGDRPTAFMRWDDSWGQADCDLDLSLFRHFPGNDRPELVFRDNSLQDGSDGSYPVAGIVFIREATAAEAGTYSLGISKETCASNPAWIQLTAWIDAGALQYHSDGYHMGNPEESRNPGMAAVGATHHWDTDAIAPYSSRGPTIDGRTKPDITGVACGRSTVYSQIPDSQCWFPGTSQAAPHVAGQAALVKQRFPHYGPAQTVRYLQQNAAERGATGADNTWGHGLASLPDPTVEPMLGATSNIDARDGANPGEVIISWDAVPEATHYRVGYVNMVSDYPVAKDRPTGEWIEAFIYVDLNAINFPPVNGRVEYAIPRLERGVRHAFTVLTSNHFVDTGSGGSVSSEFLWATNPRWTFHNVAD